MSARGRLNWNRLMTGNLIYKCILERETLEDGILQRSLRPAPYEAAARTRALFELRLLCE